MSRLSLSLFQHSRLENQMSVLLLPVPEERLSNPSISAFTPRRSIHRTSYAYGGNTRKAQSIMVLPKYYYVLLLREYTLNSIITIKEDKEIFSYFLPITTRCICMPNTKRST